MFLLRSKLFWVTSIVITFAVLIASCTKHDQVLTTAPTYNETDLMSMKAATAPTIDGTIDASWESAKKLEFETEVPDPGNNLFTGYIGQTFKGTLRSMYDDNNVYFLVEIPDADKSIKSAPWYFNPANNVAGKTGWAQETTSRSLDPSGVLTREGFGEDKFAILWNVDNSTPKFVTQTCYASCHVFGPYMDYSVTPAVLKSNAGGGNHYTNGQYEKIDMWWLHPNRGFVYGNMDDEYQDWAGGPAVTSLVGGSGNGRKLDDQVITGASTTWPFAPTYSSDATQGSVNNRQTLKLDGTGASVTVPWYVIPGSTGDFIKVADTAAGTAKRITGVSSTGVLTYDGGTIDPTVGTEYQRVGDPVTGGVGPKCLPGVIISPVKNGRADISLGANYTGTGWVYEFKRSIKTTDKLKQDIDFTGLADQPFGVAIWNRSNYQHGIKPNLLLKFNK